jgi:hypothetical protein
MLILFSRFSTFDMYMALLVPAICISFTLGAVLVTLLQYRTAGAPTEKRVSTAKELGDTVDIFVELEVDEGRRMKRARVQKKHGRTGEEV